MPPSPVSTLVPAQMPQRIKLGPVTLPINPQSVQETLTRQVVYLPAMMGAIRTDYGNGPRSWTLQGHTSQGGLPALLQLKGLEAAPGTAQKAVTFLYPFKYGTRPFSVYVDDCTWQESVSEGAFTFSYTIMLKEASPLSSQAPIIKQPVPAHGAGGARIL